MSRHIPSADARRAAHVVHVDAERGFSGGEVQVFLLMQGLREHGLRQHLVCPPGSAAAARARELDFDVVEVPMRSDLDFAGMLRLARVLRELAPDLVHLHTGRATWLGGPAARCAGVPALTTRRMDREVTPGLRSRLVHGSWTRRTVAISQAVAECLRAGGVPNGRVRTIWSAVDPDALAPTRSRESMRAELGVADDTPVVLALGTLVPRKGLDVLVEALHLRRGDRWVLWIGGEGPERGALEAHVAELGIAPRVRLLGKRADVPDLLGACDLVAMPSRREGLGVAALEAMAAGRAIVASNVGGLGQAVVHQRTGLLVPPGNVAALADALGRLLNDAALRAELARAGPTRVAEGFLASQMVDAYVRLYDEILAEVAQ